jgi:hypothetical protein
MDADSPLPTAVIFAATTPLTAFYGDNQSECGEGATKQNGPPVSFEVGPFLLLFVMCANLKSQHLGTITFETIGGGS